MLLTVQKASSLLGLLSPPSQSSAKSEVPIPHPQEKPALSEEEIERKCKSIIDEFLHINDYKVNEVVGGNNVLLFLQLGLWQLTWHLTSPGNEKQKANPARGRPAHGHPASGLYGRAHPPLAWERPGQACTRLAGMLGRGCLNCTSPSVQSLPTSPQEAVQCVEELNVPGILPVFVQVGVESTLERSQITRDHMGQLLYQLVQSEKLSKQDFFKGWVRCQRASLLPGHLFFFAGADFRCHCTRAKGRSNRPSSLPSRHMKGSPFWPRFADTLETADDMAIDIPHIWLYLAELVTPMLKEGGISMRELVM